ncbi:MAG: cyclase [Chlorobiaceae bacterium]|nr:cyclase [Chlorobiaceae bacterium]NTV61486.1 cyclase [Chlorobiaceae bacterium]
MDEHAIKRLSEGEVQVTVQSLPGDIIGVTGMVLINSEPEHVWTALTDYDNLHRNLPKVVSSRLVSRTGNDVVIEQTGKTGIFIFEKTVHFLLKVHEDYRKSITFEQESGDFRIYRGEWRLGTIPGTRGTLLVYNAEIKPAFFAPPILVGFVQYQDLPGILRAHKERAEMLDTTISN